VPKVGIIYNDAKPVAQQAADEIKSWFSDLGWQVVVTTGWGGILGYAKPDSPVCHTPIDSLVPPGFDRDMSFVVALGGDGTVLSAFRQIAPAGLPIISINTGHMGFLTESYLGNWQDNLRLVVENQYIIEQRSMITIKVHDGETVLWEALALNEMVIHREPLTSMCHFEITIGQHLPVDVAADGVIIATPTGSTAYALSAGGPVIEPAIPVLQLVPICAHSMASRALVFANTEPVIITPANKHRLVLVADGNAGCYVYPDNHVVIERSRHAARFIRLQAGEFFKVLREKLGWGLPHISKPNSVELP
jgi:NAD+ kinase